MADKESSIVVRYGDIDITYNEGSNDWKFTLRGRARSAESLAKAKEAIDKPVSAKAKKNAFEPFEAWYSGEFGVSSDSNFKKVTVTSIAEKVRRWSSFDEVWIKRANGDRKKVYVNSIFPVKGNEEQMVKVQEVQSVAQEAGAAAEKEVKKLKAYVVKPEDESEEGESN